MISSKLSNMANGLTGIDNYKYVKRVEQPVVEFSEVVKDEHSQFARLVENLSKNGFTFQSQRWEHPNPQFAHPNEPRTACFNSYSFESQRALLLIGSHKRRLCNIYIKKKYRKDYGLFNVVLSEFFRCAKATSSTIYLMPKAYSLDLPNDELLTDSLKFPRHAYRWLGEAANIRLAERYIMLIPELVRVDDNWLVYNPNTTPFNQPIITCSNSSKTYSREERQCVK